MELKIGLFDPGMSYHHRVGLAGLYMAIKHFESTTKQFGKGITLPPLPLRTYPAPSRIA